MSSKSVVERNELIAEYMELNIDYNGKGPEKLRKGLFVILDNNQDFKVIRRSSSSVTKYSQEFGDVNLNISGVYINGRDLCFHFSWDWLMPVVEKIRGTAGVCIGSDSKEKRFAFEIFGLSIVTPIETVYIYVNNYIEWYNLNKNL